MTICPLPDTELRGVYEHCMYLEMLIQAAVADGASHIALLHVDSFPVKRGWSEELAQKTDAGYALAAMLCEEDDVHDIPNTSCIFFPSAFAVNYAPIAEPVLIHAGRRCAEILREHNLPWHKLLRTNVVDDHHTLGGIYGDMVFHLGRAEHTESLSFFRDARVARTSPTRRLARRLVNGPGSQLLRRLTPEALRQRISPWLWGDFVPLAEAHAHAYREIRSRLLADPDRYLEYLRTGRPPDVGPLSNLFRAAQDAKTKGR